MTRKFNRNDKLHRRYAQNGFRLLLFVVLTAPPGALQCIQASRHRRNAVFEKIAVRLEYHWSTRSSTGLSYRLVVTFDITGPESITVFTSDDQTEIVVDLTIGDHSVELLKGWESHKVDADGSTTAVDAILTSKNPLLFNYRGLKDHLAYLPLPTRRRSTDLRPWPQHHHAEVYEEETPATTKKGRLGSDDNEDISDNEPDGTASVLPYQ